MARAECLSHPKAVAEAIRKHAPDAVLNSFETGPLATWFHRELPADGLPAVCIDARHAKAALDTAPSKTDANDADGLPSLASAGFLREVRVKSPAAMRLRALIGGRAQLVGIGIELSNHMRGVMKTFGLVVPNGGGRVFETNVRTLLSGQEALASMVLPLLETGAARRARRLPGSTTNSSRWRARAPPAG